jgi:hypothetical protein
MQHHTMTLLSVIPRLPHAGPSFLRYIRKIRLEMVPVGPIRRHSVKR